MNATELSGRRNLRCDFESVYSQMIDLDPDVACAEQIKYR